MQETERAGIVQPAENSGGILLMCINTSWEGIRKRKPDSSQWHPVTRQEEMCTN